MHVGSMPGVPGVGLVSKWGWWQPMQAANCCESGWEHVRAIKRGFLSARARERLICISIPWPSCLCEAEGAVEEVAFTISALGYHGGAPLAPVTWMNL